MKAIVCTEYGSPEGMQLREVEQPIPKENEVLIKIHATTVTSADIRIHNADPFPIRFFIAAIGQKVTQFKVGDLIFAGTGINLGTNAEYLCLPEEGAIVLKPSNLTDAEAAAIPFGGTTSLVFLKDKGKLQAGQKILIQGTSGSLGRAAVQIAKAFGAEVTGVCSTENLELVKSLGADRQPFQGVGGLCSKRAVAR